MVEYHHYYPPGVKRTIASGASSFVGEIDRSTALKYPLEPGGDFSRLEHEYKILGIIGQHHRIIGCKGFTNAGLYLERAAHGTIYQYLTALNIFALASTIYFIMTGHEVFPDIIDGEDGWAEQVKSRFETGMFPDDSHPCDIIAQECRRGQYSSAIKVLKDMRDQLGLASHQVDFNPTGERNRMDLSQRLKMLSY